MLKGTVVDYLYRINSELRRDVIDDMKAVGITDAQLAVLLSLSESGKTAYSVKDTQEMLHVSQPTATGIVSRLERNGFVTSKNPKKDRRVKLIVLTKKGEQCVEQATYKLMELQREAYEHLTKDEREELDRIIIKLYDAIIEK